MKKIRIGIFGGFRGYTLGKNFLLSDGEIVAVCDINLERAKESAEKLNCDTVYTSFDEFLEHPMDAMLIANYFHDHARFAIRALERGIHVLSECTSNGTMAEGVALVRAVEKSNAIYMLAENYPHMKFNREMKRIADGGTLGKIVYAEGEYNHPISPDDTKFIKDYVPFKKHWRNSLPRTYYLTHSLAPIMYAVGARPKTATALITYAQDEANPWTPYNPDVAAIIMTQNDDNSVYRITGCASYGAHHKSYRLCGINGQFENLRGMDGKVMLRYSPWSKPEGMEENNLYMPDWNDKDADLIEKSGHGGGDFLITREFLDCIREGRKPDFDVYFATTMASVAIQAHRSAINGGIPYRIPDFRNEADRKEFENDTDTPFYSINNESAPTMQSCINADYKPTDEEIKHYEEIIKDNTEYIK